MCPSSFDFGFDVRPGVGTGDVALFPQILRLVTGGKGGGGKSKRFDPECRRSPDVEFVPVAPTEQ